MEKDTENSYVTFLFKEEPSENPQNVVVVTELNGNNFSMNQMAKIANTNVWYKTYRLNNHSKFSYSIAINDPLIPVWSDTNIFKRTGNWKPDKYNPDFLDFGFYKVSIVSLPNAASIATDSNGIITVEINHLKLFSKVLNIEKIIDLYSFAKRKNNTDKYKVLILLDGDRYIKFNKMIAGIEASMKDAGYSLIIAFVHTGYPDRAKELSCNADFVSFLSDEVIPYIEKENQIDLSDITIAGSSMGGLTAVYASLLKPEIFKNVLAQSGSYQWKPEGNKKYEWILDQYKKAPTLNTKFYLTVGKFETERRDELSQLEINQKFDLLLKQKGYNVKYSEYYGGHDYLHWQIYIIEALQYFYQ